MEGENAAFWLPTHFLTDDDDKEKLHHPTPANRNGFLNNRFGLGFGFDNDEDVSEDDGFLLSHLTRHLAHTSLLDSHNTKSSTPERPWVFSTSPQSTLTGFGSGWSGRSGFSSNGSPNGPSRLPSPPLTPEVKDDAAWDLLYEAAGQVARLKMNAVVAQMNRGLLNTPHNNNSSHLNLYPKQYQEQKWAQNSNNLGRQERESMLYCQRHHHHDNQRRGCGGALGLPQSAWPPLTSRQSHHQRQANTGPQMRGMFQNGTGIVGPTMGSSVKKQSTGTGVFIPRRASSPPRLHQYHHQSQQTELRNKPNVVMPTQSLNMNLEETNLKTNSRFGVAGFPTDHELMMARRNAILGQQSRKLLRSESNAAATMVGQGHEIRLPNDWTY